jgi:hypothetical protein
MCPFGRELEARQRGWKKVHGLAICLAVEHLLQRAPPGNTPVLHHHRTHKMTDGVSEALYAELSVA